MPARPGRPRKPTPPALMAELGEAAADIAARLEQVDAERARVLAERGEHICRGAREGLSTTVLGDLFGLSPQHVARIIRSRRFQR